VQLRGFLTVRNVDPHHLQRYLLPHEDVSVVIRRHPAMLLRYILEALAGLIIAGVLSDLIANGTIRTVIWCAWLIGLSRLAFKTFEWSDEYFAVTSVRVILVHGITVRRVDMMPLKKITDLTLNRSLLGRMLGYGTVVLESAGQDQALSSVEYVPEPEAVYLDISAVVFGFADD
jgi:Bacterial PH domain